jgi:uncharacterized protein (DUF1778 family)
VASTLTDARRIDIVDTKIILQVMSKIRAPSAESLDHRAAVMVAERSAAPDPKGSINLRIETGTRQLIDDAAAILGKTRTEFMVDSARRQAIDVLLDQRLCVLDSDRSDAFMRALDNPPAPGAKLRALLRRAPAWRK